MPGHANALSWSFIPSLSFSFKCSRLNSELQEPSCVPTESFADVHALAVQSDPALHKTKSSLCGSVLSAHLPVTAHEVFTPLNLNIEYQKARTPVANSISGVIHPSLVYTLLWPK